MCAADLFVGAAGASTISEVLATGVNALLVARQQVEKEQEIHSQLLAGRGLVRALRLTEWTSRRLREDLAEALENPIVGTLPPLLGGASRSARMLVGAFREQHSTTHAGTR
jgi:predicted glycosyltransferase